MISTKIAKRILFSVIAFLWTASCPAIAAELDDWHAGQRQAAIAAWERMADAGDAEASLFLGYVYAKGLGVTRDLVESARRYRQAAELGLPEAQYELGLMYELGDGVPRDPDEAARWYALSSAQACPSELSAGGRLGD